MSQNADIQISAISAVKIFADSRYADIEKKCRYADIADADINIGTPLHLLARICNSLIRTWIFFSLLNSKPLFTRLVLALAHLEVTGLLSGSYWLLPGFFLLFTDWEQQCIQALVTQAQPQESKFNLIRKKV